MLATTQAPPGGRLGGVDPEEPPSDDGDLADGDIPERLLRGLHRYTAS